MADKDVFDAPDCTDNPLPESLPPELRDRIWRHMLQLGYHFETTTVDGKTTVQMVGSGSV